MLPQSTCSQAAATHLQAGLSRRTLRQPAQAILKILGGQPSTIPPVMTRTASTCGRGAQRLHTPGRQPRCQLGLAAQPLLQPGLHLHLLLLPTGQSQQQEGQAHPLSHLGQQAGQVPGQVCLSLRHHHSQGRGSLQRTVTEGSGSTIQVAGRLGCQQASHMRGHK